MPAYLFLIATGRLSARFFWAFYYFDTHDMTCQANVLKSLPCAAVSHLAVGNLIDLDFEEFIMETAVQVAPEKLWFYESEGQRKGGVPEAEIIALIKEGKLTHGASVWCKGMPDWMRIENTDLRVHLDDSMPPPLTGEHANNTVVWVLAFAPILGTFLEGILAGLIYHGNEHLAESALEQHKFWFVTLALNIVLSYVDEKKLKEGGVKTDKFSGWWVCVVPVYLFQRAQALKHNLAYFIVWIVCFVLMISMPYQM